MDKLYLLVDPLLHSYGSPTPAILLGKKLINDYIVEIVSPIINKNVEHDLILEGFKVNNMNKQYKFDNSMLILEGWVRNVEFINNIDNNIIINFSQCFTNNSHIYYAPGPITFALDDIYQEMSIHYKIFYKMLRQFVLYRDKRFNKRLRNKTSIFIAVSEYCANLYRRWGIEIEDVIYPPIDTNIFKPSTKTPTENYVLTYIGKESRYSVLNEIAKRGIKIKGFGAKVPYIPSYILNNPNIELLGEVTTDELIELYSNALYTLFPFTHEPFGYIPIESMACATPVLTYNKQGPSETVIHNKTGWLLNNDAELIEKAVEIWKYGYNRSVRDYCLVRAKDFSLDKIVDKWRNLLNTIYIKSGNNDK